MKTLIVVCGPTAVGKTSQSIELARFFNTGILSFDSRQFYREMSIGTAKPSAEEQAAAPHYFIDNLSIHDDYNVSQFETEALALLEKLFVYNDVVVSVGGSGLYQRALCYGIDDLPDPTPELREGLKKDLEEKGIEYLQQKVKELDPEFYQIVDLKNPKRLLRALEVCISTGKTYTSLRKNQVKNRPFQIIQIGLDMDREKLYDRINLRVDLMVKDGLIEENQRLYKHKNLNALNTVGYKEIFEHFDGKISLDQAIENIKTSSRRYAKRQLTWFRKDENISWFDAGNINALIEHINNLRS
jgi:tRNA dimethylallyltransferase